MPLPLFQRLKKKKTFFKSEFKVYVNPDKVLFLFRSVKYNIGSLLLRIFDSAKKNLLKYNYRKNFFFHFG